MEFERIKKKERKRKEKKRKEKKSDDEYLKTHHSDIDVQ